jgi:hypothetical protein
MGSVVEMSIIRMMVGARIQNQIPSDGPLR